MICRIHAPATVAEYEDRAAFCRQQHLPLPPKPFVVEHHGKDVDVMNCWEANGMKYCAIKAPFIPEYDIIHPRYLRALH